MAIVPRLLTSTELSVLETRGAKASSTVIATNAAKSDALRPGIKFTERGNFVLLDSAVLKSEISQLLGSIIMKLCQKLQAEIRLIDIDYEFPEERDVELFLTGVYQSIEYDSKYLPSLKVDKKPYDLGKSSGFFLKLRGEVTKGSYINVGLYGLQICHRYLGNDSSRATDDKDRESRKPPLETYLQKLFGPIQGFSDRWRDYQKLIQELFYQLRFSDAEDGIVKSIVSNYQKSFEDVRREFETPVMVTKKGSKKKVQTGTRRPKRPNCSPTLLGIEFKDFIDPLINLHWNSLEPHKKDFKENVRILGYYPAMRNIREVYDARYEVTRNYSNLTTKRLQEARSYGLLAPNAKKTDFNDTVRKQFFEKRSIENRVSIFVDELRKLIPDKFRYEAIRKFLEGMAGVDSMNPQQLILTLGDKVAMAYPRAEISIGNFKYHDIKISDTKAKQVKVLIDKLSKTVELSRTIPERLVSLMKCAFTRKVEVMKLTNFALLKNEVIQLENLVRDDFWTESAVADVWLAYYSCRVNNKSPMRFRDELIATLTSASAELKKSLEGRDRKLFGVASDAFAATNEITNLMANLKI